MEVTICLAPSSMSSVCFFERVMTLLNSHSVTVEFQ